LLSDRLGSGSVRKLQPGRHANNWTVAMNLKVTAAGPTRTTTLGMWPRGLQGINGPVQPQVSAPAGVTTTASTLECVGSDNGILIKNATGSVPVTVWSFGRFDAYPAPRPTYVGAPTSASPAGTGRLIKTSESTPRAAFSALDQRLEPLTS
jgi:hypothetical protein